VEFHEKTGQVRGIALNGQLVGGYPITGKKNKKITDQKKINHLWRERNQAHKSSEYAQKNKQKICVYVFSYLISFCPF
jgi:predicted transcriptional regulator YdeE